MQPTLVNPQIQAFQLTGHLNAVNAAEVQAQLSALVSSEQSSQVLIDMAHVESVDSAGLMALVATLSLAQSLNKQLCLCCIAPSVRIIFELTQLDRVFKIYDNRAAFEQM